MRTPSAHRTPGRFPSTNTPISRQNWRGSLARKHKVVYLRRSGAVSTPLRRRPRCRLLVTCRAAPSGAVSTPLRRRPRCRASEFGEVAHPLIVSTPLRRRPRCRVQSSPVTPQGVLCPRLFGGVHVAGASARMNSRLSAGVSTPLRRRPRCRGHSEAASSTVGQVSTPLRRRPRCRPLSTFGSPGNRPCPRLFGGVHVAGPRPSPAAPAGRRVHASSEASTLQGLPRGLWWRRGRGVHASSGASTLQSGHS